MKLSEWIRKLGTQSAIDFDAVPEFKKFLEAVPADLEVPSTFVNTVESQHLTKDAAKNNPDIRDAYYAQFFNGMDATLKKGLTELGISEEDQKLFLEEKQTGKNIVTSLKKIQELEAAKGGATKGEKSELQTEINKLKSEIAASNTTRENDLKALKTQHENELVGFLMDGTLSSYNYGNEPEAKAKGTVLAKHFLNSAINEKGLKIVKTDTGLVLKTKTDTDHYENNKIVTFKDFTDGIMASNKLIAVTEQNKGITQNHSAPAKINSEDVDPLKQVGANEFQQARASYRTADAASVQLQPQHI